MFKHQGGTDMALVACPECDKPVSDQAPLCPYCGYPVAEMIQEMRKEAAARMAARRAAAARRRARKQKITIVGVIVVIIVVLILILIVSNSPHPPLLEMNSHTESATPGNNAFSASGKLTLTYSCEANANHVAIVDFSLVDIHTQQVVWKKTLVCTQQGSSVTDTVTVSSSSYDIGTQVYGQDDWSMKITQG
jgi:hypothetical protein